MMGAALGTRGWESFRIGYVGGLGFYLGSLHWLLLIPYRWHGIPFGPALGWAALSAYSALYPASWVWLLSGIWKVEDGSVAPKGKLQEWSAVLGATWLQRAVWMFLGAAGWVGFEMLIARVFSGFPWNLLGGSQYQLLPLIQVSSLVGIYGVGFVVVWVSLCLLSAGLVVLSRPTFRSAWISEIIVPVAVVGMLFAYGFRQLRHQDERGETIKVTFVQPSIPQTVIWDTNKVEERFQALIALSEQALSNRPALLLWPEAAVPKLLRYDKEVFHAITNLAGAYKVWMIIGADDAEARGDSTRGQVEYYNSSFLLSPAGRLVDRYRKRALVIFGEYVPLEKWLPFMKFFTPVEGGFTPGDRAIQFELTEPKAKVGVLICFEDIFPHLVREYAEDDTDFLVNLTNNGWFGESSAQWQHAVSALFRAVENGLPLVRCSNNGLTCWVDAHGRLREIFRDAGGTVYGAGCMTAEIPILGEGQKRTRTLYRQHGDWFGWSCVVLSVGVAVRRAVIAMMGRRARLGNQSL
jgi:apolipoprotein N-acyltransferase